MAQFNDTLQVLRGRVMSARPDISAPIVDGFINDRVRQVMDTRTFWSDLLVFGNLPIPDSHDDGTISLTKGSATVTGTDTVLPVNDIVDTTLPDGVDEIGYAEVTPASMDGITDNSLLYVDADGDPEIVPVVRKFDQYFIGKFSKVHDADCTVTQSSLANLQLRVGQAYPTFTVGAVVSATELILTLPWGGGSLADQAYSIVKMYVALASDLKGLIAMKDEATGYPVRIHVPLEEANFRDPRRTMVSGSPYYNLVDLGANDQGNMLYEIWPAKTSEGQFSFLYWKQWPELVKDTDRPPHFINPSIFFHGALADAKRYRGRKDDWAYDPQGAMDYERRFFDGVQAAKNADEAKCLQAIKTWFSRGMTPGSVDQWALMPVEAMGWDFGSVM